MALTPHFALHCVKAGAPAALGHPELHVCLACGTPWWGALVPKRWAKRSVTRHAIRRQVYALASLVQGPYPAAVWVVRLRRSFDPRTFISASSAALKAAVRAELAQLFAAAGLSSTAGNTP
jgi:ribonuclease P protein component